MPLSLDKIEALAPDQASLDAARKLLKPSGWPTLAKDAGALVWGECQGSGATPYRVVISESDGGYKCTCPSRKFPCKHSLALMWMRAEMKTSFPIAPVPPWVTDWLGRRRSGTAAETTVSAEKSIRSVAAKVEADPANEAKAAAARERNAKEREASILGGLDELDLWLTDQMEAGLAGFATEGVSRCRLMAQRLVDAKASGLATRLDSLPSRLLSRPEAERPVAAVEELGLFHLMAEAYRRQSDLSPGLRADLRQTVGWPVTRETLLADPEAQRKTGRWVVFSVRSEVQPDNLRRTETWLVSDGAEPAFAVLIDYVPVSVGAVASGYAVGDGFAAELVYYPSAVPLRALIVQQEGPTVTAAWVPASDQDLSDAYGTYETALVQKPWLGDWPLLFGRARLRRRGEALFLCSEKTGWGALPLEPSQQALARPLLALESLAGAGIWDGKTLFLCWAETSQGRWLAV